MLLLREQKIREGIMVGARSHCWEIVPVSGASLKVVTQHM